MPEDQKLLEPLLSVVSGVTRVLVAVLAVTLILSFASPDVGISWGSGDGCVTADWIGGSNNGLFAVRGGAEVNVIPQYCASNMDGYQHSMNVLSELPSFLLLVGGLVITDRLLKAAARNGVYTRQTAARVRTLGWWVLAGSILSGVIQATAQAALLATLTDEAPLAPEAWLHSWAPPYLAILTGLALIIFSRIMRVGTDMREDIEGTI
jgi:hypothetical protein